MVKYYKNSALYYGSSLKSSGSALYGLRWDADDGVFVVDSYDGTTHGEIYTAQPYRAAVIPSNRESFGSTNMNTTNRYGMCVRRTSGDGGTAGLQMSVTQGRYATDSNTIYSTDTMRVSYAGSAKVEKVEIVEEIPYFETYIGQRTGEIVYASGWTLFGLSADGSIRGTRSIILARCTTSEKPTLLWTRENVPRCENSSLVFSGDGSKLYAFIGDNGTPLSSKVSTSMPEDAIAGNNGLLAVSCMATLDGKAAWLGYKNGIYKLYQGPTPLNGMPGEKITIKGHEFVCLAYGPFYARLS